MVTVKAEHAVVADRLRKPECRWSDNYLWAKMGCLSLATTMSVRLHKPLLDVAVASDLAQHNAPLVSNAL
jgi:hypothetical protein